MKIKFTGKREDNHSLSIINRYIYEELKRYCIEFIDDENDEIPDIEIRHTYPPIWKKSMAKVIIYIQEWEYEKCPLEWIINFNTIPNRLIVPSEYIKEIYENAGVRTPITVIQNGYNDKIFTKIDRVRIKPYRYLYIGSYQYRKGYDIISEVWDKSFGKIQDVELYVKDMTHVYGRQNGEKIKRMKNSENVIYIDEEFSEEEMGRLYRKCDCVIVCSRGESFCMPILEASMCGLDIICPEIGPYKEIVQDERCFVKCRRIVVDPIQKFIGKSGDAFSNMGSHFHINEVRKEELEKKIREKMGKRREIKERKGITWKEVGKKYFDIIKYEFNKNI